MPSRPVPQMSLPSRFYEPIPISSFSRINLHRNKAVVQLCISLSSCIRPPVAGRLEQRINTVGPVIVNRLFWWLAVLVVSLLGFVDGIQMHFKVCRSPFRRSEDSQLFEDPKSKKKIVSMIYLNE